MIVFFTHVSRLILMPHDWIPFKHHITWPVRWRVVNHGRTRCRCWGCCWHIRRGVARMTDQRLYIVPYHENMSSAISGTWVEVPYIRSKFHSQISGISPESMAFIPCFLDAPGVCQRRGNGTSWIWRRNWNMISRLGGGGLDAVASVVVWVGI